MKLLSMDRTGADRSSDILPKHIFTFGSSVMNNNTIVYLVEDEDVFILESEKGFVCYVSIDRSGVSAEYSDNVDQAILLTGDHDASNLALILNRNTEEFHNIRYYEDYANKEDKYDQQCNTGRQTDKRS